MDHPHDEAPPHPPVEVGAGDVTAHPRHTGRRWFDLAMAVTAILISSVSLVVAIDHGRTERELVLAASWPFVQENTNVSDGGVTLSLTNSGIGPARMEWLEVLYDGKPVRSPAELLQQCCGLSRAPGTAIGPLVGRFEIGNPNQQVLRPGATLVMMRLEQNGARQPLAEALVHAWPGISFRGCYCSVFSECWIGDLEDLVTRRVATCEDNPDRFKVSER